MPRHRRQRAKAKPATSDGVASAISASAMTTYDALKAPNAPERIMGCFNLLETGDFSVFTIVCGEQQWKVHKAVISQQSDYFRSACNGSFSEAGKGQIDLSCDDEVALATLIRFMYTGDLPARTKRETEGWAVPDALLPLRVHVLADKYGVVNLVEAAADEFMRIAKGWCYEVEFASWLIAVQEETAEHSSLRKLMLSFVQCDLECLLDTSGGLHRKSVDALKDALARYPESALTALFGFFESPKPEK